MTWGALSRASVEGEVAFFRTGGAVLTLFSWEAFAKDANVDAQGSGFSGFALAHNVAEREQVDATLAEAVSAGARIMQPAEDLVFGRCGYFADPEGHLWEVAWNPSPWPRTAQSRYLIRHLDPGHLENRLPAT